MKNRFYDANMNGVNWEALKDTYESLLPHITDVDELHVLIMDMIGKLNASHGDFGWRLADHIHDQDMQLVHIGDVR